MRLVGTNDLQVCSAYQPIVQRQFIGGTEKWIAYIVVARLYPGDRVQPGVLRPWHARQRDISDRGSRLADNPSLPLADPANPTVAELQAPSITQYHTPVFMGAHTTLPVLDYHLPQLGPVNADRDFVVMVNEAIANECNESRQMTFMVDITDEERPFPVSNLNVDEDEGGTDHTQRYRDVPRVAGG